MWDFFLFVWMEVVPPNIVNFFQANLLATYIKTKKHADQFLKNKIKNMGYQIVLTEKKVIALTARFLLFYLFIFFEVTLTKLGCYIWLEVLISGVYFYFFAKLVGVFLNVSSSVSQNVLVIFSRTHYSSHSYEITQHLPVLTTSSRNATN